MMEKIIDIEDRSMDHPTETWGSYSGYVITTDKQKIKIGIYDQSSCCENFGYMASNDDLSQFVGADVLSIELVDDALNAKKWEDADLYEPATMFVNINTDKGTFQIACYNSHNGYYGHSAFVSSEQLNHETCL